MPVFTFEKISPPVSRGPIDPIEQKQRGVIVQILERLVEARGKRMLKQGKVVQDKVVIVSRDPPAPR
ncbi:hypothetical protein JQ615_28045 [Bradyrhizobium jicamae]|uniref:Uncharacterized protein n=1 Tax=Bradyrhizobium jicamae TaxID=280332 RepID=A0ABS5FR09_9BRAD|nr:hypothetical protein [Bradyrhizobium jicamae]MBR0799248.1 hypothetical protein [Bradyrhizobium jicamae]MBR0938083.1 hypothetical protein [Bradyrhizobium jicamae]